MKTYTPLPSVKHPNRKALAKWARENLPTGDKIKGYVYLICAEGELQSEDPMFYASHYLGSTWNPQQRFIQHLYGKSAGGAAVTNALNHYGYDYTVIRLIEFPTYEGAEAQEQRWKKCKRPGRERCPRCKNLVQRKEHA